MQKDVKLDGHSYFFPGCLFPFAYKIGKEKFIRSIFYIRIMFLKQVLI